MAGRIRDHTEAAIIIPEAKPRNTVLTLWEISPLKNQTMALPRAVAAKMIVKPMTVIMVGDMVHLLKIAGDSLREAPAFCA